MKDKKLIMIIEKARNIFKSALNLVLKETALPAYLIEGILLDLLADVRAQKVAEITAEYENTLRVISPPEQTDTNVASEE